MGFCCAYRLRAGEALGMRYADKRIAVSRSIGELITAKYGKPCDVIPNGVVFSDMPQQSDRVAELGLEPGRYILTVGRLVPEKRQLDLLRAFSSVAIPGWKLAIVGKIDPRRNMPINWLPKPHAAKTWSWQVSRPVKRSASCMHMPGCSFFRLRTRAFPSCCWKPSAMGFRCLSATSRRTWRWSVTPPRSSRRRLRGDRVEAYGVNRPEVECGPTGCRPS